MSRPSFPGRDSGIVDFGAYLGGPAQPLLPSAIEEAPRRGPRGTWVRDAGTILGAISLLLSSAALVITIRTERDTLAVAYSRVPSKAAKVAPFDDAEDAPGQPEAREAETEIEPEVTARPVTAPATPTARREPSARAPAPATRTTPAPSASPVPAAPASPAAEPTRTTRTLDELMNGATATVLPSVPSRDEVARVLRGLSDEVAQCRPQGMERTTVTTRVTIDGATGGVARATMDGELRWTPTGACIAEALSGARFSRFERDRFEVQFPYRL